MKATTGQPPENCQCYAASHSDSYGGCVCTGCDCRCGCRLRCDFYYPNNPFNSSNPCATDCCNYCCDSGGGDKTTTAPLFTLPPECYNPDGTSCEWYKDCLEKKYQCESTQAAYALSYATKFCELYSESYNKFSQYGQEWIDAVRRCLQMKLAPLLRPSITTTCEEIRNIAFKSHTECYIYPKSEQSWVSYCFLNYLDWWRVFWIVKGAFTDFPSESLTGYLDTSHLCSDFHTFYENIPARSVHLTVDNVSKTKNTAMDLNKLAALIGGSMSHLLNWNLERLDYFAYHLNESKLSNSNQLIVALLIVDKDLLSNDSNNTIIINQTMTDLIEAIKLGRITINTSDGMFYVSKLLGCINIMCNQKNMNITAPPYQSSQAVKNEKLNYLILCCIFVSSLYWMRLIIS